jgi:hypothetical protein
MVLVVLSKLVKTAKLGLLEFRLEFCTYLV